MKEESTTQTPTQSAVGSTALFAVGDLVRHKASKSVAVVVHVWDRCVSPDHATGFHCVARGNCERQQIDKYDLSYDFGKMIEGVNGCLLEAANAEASRAKSN